MSHRQTAATLLFMVVLGVVLAGCGGSSGLSAVPSLEEVTSTPEVHLSYPGAIPACHIGLGTAAGKHGLVPAFATRVLSADATWQRLFLWYHERLVALGWQWQGYGKSTQGAQVLADHYTRGNEVYVVAVVDPAKLVAAGCTLHHPKPLVFETSLVATPTVSVHNAPVPVRLHPRRGQARRRPG